MRKISPKFMCLATAILMIILSGCSFTISSRQTTPNSLSSIEEKSSLDSSTFDSSTANNSRGDYYVEGKGDVFPMIERIVKAYKAKDPSTLTDEKEEYIYNCAVSVIKDNINISMTDFEKTKAIHDYIILNTQYDTDSFNELKAENPDSASPYGLFKNGKAICLGYTLTFQLLCQMAEIECITIHATSNGGEEHGWNMIKLDNNWYHVDTTWDDPLPDQEGRLMYDYFCVADLFMKMTGHEWDSSKYPLSEFDINKREELLYN